MRPSARCALVVAVCTIGGGSHLHSQQPALLARAGEIPVGPGSGTIVVVDVNRDGHPDIVARHLLQKRVTIFLGDGKGAFAPSPSNPIALTNQPGGIALADLNGDAIPDLAVTASERDEVDIFLGNGTGGFTRAPGSPLVASPSRDFFTRGVALRDVNGDRRLDIVTTNGRESTFSILFGDGRGGFTPGPTTRRESNDARHVFDFGDINGDGHVDAAVGHFGHRDNPEPGRVSVLLGDGTGVFRDGAPMPTLPTDPHSLTLADVNGDRRLDLVISHGDRRLSVLLNDGTGTFTQAPGSPFGMTAEVYEVVARDIDRDGKIDLIAAAADSATVLLGDGRGRFTPAPGSPFHSGPGSYFLAVGDFNEDGKQDVVTSSFEGDRVTLFLGR